MKKNDPCTSICEWDGRTGWCLGCGRTIPEIRAWRKMTPFRRSALLRELPRRVEQLATATAKPSRERGDVAKPRPSLSTNGRG